MNIGAVKREDPQQHATQMRKMHTGEAIYSNRLQQQTFQPHAAM